MTEERDELIRHRKSLGMSVPELMAEYGLSRARLYQILNPEAAKGQIERKHARAQRARGEA